MLTAHDVHGFKFAALDTLQYGLARDAEHAHGFTHRQKAVSCLAVEASLEFIGQTNAPRSARREMLAGDDAIVEQTMDR